MAFRVDLLSSLGGREGGKEQECLAWNGGASAEGHRAVTLLAALLSAVNGQQADTDQTRAHCSSALRAPKGKRACTSCTRSCRDRRSAKQSCSVTTGAFPVCNANGRTSISSPCPTQWSLHRCWTFSTCAVSADQAHLPGSRPDERNADRSATRRNRPGRVCLWYRLSGWSPSGSGRPCRTWCGR